MIITIGEAGTMPQCSKHEAEQARIRRHHKVGRGNSCPTKLKIRRENRKRKEKEEEEEENG
jgi:hypothetical protein